MSLSERSEAVTERTRYSRGLGRGSPQQLNLWSNILPDSALRVPRIGNQRKEHDVPRFLEMPLRLRKGTFAAEVRSHRIVGWTTESILALPLFATEERDDADSTVGELLIGEDGADLICDCLRLAIVPVVRIASAAFDVDID